MRALRSILPRHGLGPALRRAASILRESILLAATIAGLEFVGRYATDDWVDLAVVFGLAMVGAILVKAARGGWMPASRQIFRSAALRLRTLGRRLTPRYAVAFRPSPEARPLPDRTLARPILWIVAALFLLGALGHRLFEGLTFLKESVSYTLYLGGLVVIWSLLLVTVSLGFYALIQGIAPLSRRPGARNLLLPVLVVTWVGGLIGVFLLPGVGAVGLLLLLGWLGGRSLGDEPARSYLFCRRDARGRARTIPVHIYLRQVYTAIVMALALIVLIGQSERLWFGGWPQGPYTFTTCFALLATQCAVILVARAGVHFRRVMGGRGVPPEVPLTPTLWIRRPPVREAGDPEERREAFWYRVARENGWLVLRGADAPEHDYDLAYGLPAGPKRFQPREPLDDDDARFQLERRLHIVMRRRFHRHLQSLYKQLRGELPAEGSGFLFCPHVWLVPGVVRDVEPSEGTGTSGSLVGPTFYGPPYAQVFPQRVRRYIGSVLRDLQIDILYWEDAVSWQDLRRVLGVAFECYDQRRIPVEERHFVGLPRVRVVIQEEAAETEPPSAIPARDEGGPPDEAPGHARILLVLRDRGEREDEKTPEPADYGIRTPSLV